MELFRKFLDYPTSERNAMFRDYFLLMFLLIGINSKDLLLACKDNLINGRLEYIREKTHKKYSVKIEPEAEELLKRYKGKDYLLEAMDHCKHYKSFAHEMNDHLKMIGEETVEMIPDTEDLFGTPHLQKTIKPIIPGISTYYARHCWATFAYEAGVPLDTTSQALGLSAGNRTTRRYNPFFLDGVRPISGAYLSHKHNRPSPLEKRFPSGRGDITTKMMKGWGVVYKVVPVKRDSGLLPLEFETHYSQNQSDCADMTHSTVWNG